MPSVTLYQFDISPPCRSVRLTARHLGVKVNLKEVNVPNGEHMTPEFLKLNPEHTIPTMKDGDFVLWESRAIQMYLANAYGKDHPDLYPEDPVLRATVNRLMHFDAGVLYKSFTDYAFPMFFGGADPDPKKKEKLEEALAFLNTFLSKSKPFVVSKTPTIADHCLSVSVSTIKECGVADLTKYKKIEEWLTACAKEMVDYEEINQKPAATFGQFMKSKLSKN